MSKLSLNPIQKHKTSKELAYDELKKAILKGHISPDDILTETSLAEAFDISRTPIRESLSELTSEGLLVHIQRKGYKIRQITESEKDQIMYLRISMESEGLRKLAQQVTTEQIDELETILTSQIDAMENNDRVRNIELDQLFHETILDFADQQLFKKIFQDIYNLTRAIGHTALMKEGRMKEVINEHRKIVDALKEQNSEHAAKYLEEHLNNTKSIVKKI
ncbi:GntR family transcriptional regulator [Alkalibacillus aidingensis]|uniref:GntR family transcriptional regulator n=1 Tax=Alkalibacillus aidingensis TaxID=2747607 RepID=UPI0016605FF4|nr:GntR family transcriptional regulator [Alkalibacillus aidingensis]